MPAAFGKSTAPLGSVLAAIGVTRHLPPTCYRTGNLPDGLDSYLIRRAAECATITCDQLKACTLPGGAEIERAKQR